MPSASWTEVGASIGMTGDAAAGYFWRIRERLGQMEILRQRRLDALAKIAEAAAELEQIEREIEALPPFRWTHADGGD